MEIDIALLVLRIALALVLFGHCAQKLFGWFRGRGIGGTAAIFESSGLRPGRLMVAAAGLTELVAAVLLALGLAIPVAVTMAAGAMLTAAFSVRHNGLWAHLGGYEVPLAYGALAVVLGISGPGRYALDAVVPVLSGAHGVLWAIGELVVALVVASPLIVMIERTRHAAKGRPA